jgi:hypothetical protein
LKQVTQSQQRKKYVGWLCELRNKAASNAGLFTTDGHTKGSQKNLPSQAIDMQ